MLRVLAKGSGVFPRSNSLCHAFLRGQPLGPRMAAAAPAITPFMGMATRAPAPTAHGGWWGWGVAAAGFGVAVTATPLAACEKKQQAR